MRARANKLTSLPAAPALTAHLVAHEGEEGGASLSALALDRSSALQVGPLLHDGVALLQRKDHLVAYVLQQAQVFVLRLPARECDAVAADDADVDLLLRPQLWQELIARAGFSGRPASVGAAAWRAERRRARKSAVAAAVADVLTRSRSVVGRGSENAAASATASTRRGGGACTWGAAQAAAAIPHLCSQYCVH